MITQKELFESKKECCGCGSCVDSCPKSVLVMTIDSSGFYYPQIVNPGSCIDCKLCLNVCPEKVYESIESDFQGFFAGYLEDDADLDSCASGGLATAISRKFISRGGVVYGCTYSDGWKSILYRRAERIKDLETFKTSKYAQSIKDHVYRDILEDLKSGKDVLFIGLPCDILAVKIRIPEKYSKNIYLLELICHGPTSLKVHRQYLEQLEKKNGKVVFFSTRTKKNGKWKPFYIQAVFENGQEHHEEFHKSAYGAAFRYLKRPSCYVCKIKGNHLAGDLMIGDYHYVEKGMKGYNPHGVSSALVHNEKGNNLLEGLEDFGFFIIKISERNAIGNRAITEAINAPKHQEDFEKTFRKNGLRTAFKLYFVTKSNIERTLKARIMDIAVKVKRVLIPTFMLRD